MSAGAPRSLAEAPSKKSAEPPAGRVDFARGRAHSPAVSEKEPKFCVVETTIDSEAGAKELARAPLAAKLAACVQIFPIRSLYEWNGEPRDEPELLVQMKARVEDYDALAAAIRAASSL